MLDPVFDRLEADLKEIAYWLGTQFDRDEVNALAATAGRWETAADPEECDGIEVRADQSAASRPRTELRWVVGSECGGGVYGRADAEHIVAWQPQRARAEVAAKRALLLHAEQLARVTTDEDPYFHRRAALGMLKAMAKPYAERDGFKAEWERA